MILPIAPVQTLGVAPLVLALMAVLAYAVAAWPTRSPSRLPAPALVAGWLLHAVLLGLDIGGWGRGEPGARLGFGPVLSLTVWLVLAVHEIESRFMPLPGVRRVLAINGAAVVLVAWAFPGEVRAAASVWAPVHWLLGVASYALFGAAVLHAWMLDSAVTGITDPGALATESVQIVNNGAERQSLLGWTVFAALLLGRQWRGWRGRRATRWLYAGAVLLLLAYVGSRFVFEVLVPRG